MIMITLQIVDTCKPEDHQIIFNGVFPADSSYLYANSPIKLDSGRTLTAFMFTPTIVGGKKEEEEWVLLYTRPSDDVVRRSAPYGSVEEAEKWSKTFHGCEIIGDPIRIK